MKILNIIQCTNLGGMEQSTLNTMAVLKDAGHEVCMLSLHPVGALKPLAEARGIPIHGLPNYRLAGLGNIGWLRRQIQAFEPDRIWLTGHNFGSLLAAHVSSVPTFLSIHFHHEQRPMLLWRVFYGFARRFCRSIRFISHYIYEEVAHLFPEEDRPVCFPNIFYLPEEVMPQDEARRALDLPEKMFIVGNAGWLIPRKAFDVFLRTAEAVRRQVPDALFVIAGDGSARAELEQLADTLGVSENVRFLGWLENLAPFYAAIDVLLFNSNFDALGRTPVEALTYGTAVVASVTHGGLGEFIRHGRDGFLLDHHNPDILAEELVRLYRDPEARTTVAEAGQAHVLKVGSPERHLQELNRMMELT